MKDEKSDSTNYCDDIVRSLDEDRWLAAQYANNDARRSLIALSALHCEIRRIPSLVNEPTLGEIRFRWWRDALAEIAEGKKARAHPVVEEIETCGLVARARSKLLDDAINAHARGLYGEPFVSIGDLTQWFEETEGVFDQIAVMVLDGEESLALGARKAGAAFALAREGRSVAPALSKEIPETAIGIKSGQVEILQSAPAAVAPALLHLSLTRAYARKGNSPFLVWKRARLFTAMAFGAI